MYGGSPSNVIKNNRNLLKKRTRSVSLIGRKGKVIKEQFDHVILNTQLHTNIKKRLLKEQKKIYYKRLVLFIVLFSILMYWIIGQS